MEGIILSTSKFIYGSIILAIINGIVRVFGFGYKIVLSKLIGPQGIGLFQMVFPILMVFITLTTAGIPIAVSKMVSRENSINNHTGIKKIFTISFIFTLTLSLILSLTLLLFAQNFTDIFWSDSGLVILIRSICPAIIIISLSSLIRGYFYGLQKVAIPGASQIIEQIVRISFVLGILYYLNIKSSKLGALIAVWGISIGELVGLITLIINYKITNLSLRSNNMTKLKFKDILIELMTISIPITLSRFINVLMQMGNTVLIPKRLVLAGYSMDTAISTLGKVMGMTMPFVMLPFIFTSALVVNIIPDISNKKHISQYSSIKKDISLSIHTTLLISIPLTFIYIFFSEHISLFFYNDIEVGRYMKIMGCGTIFLSLHHTLSGILHGLGKQVQTTINYILGMSLQLFLTYQLVANPNFGIKGFFIGFLLSSITIFLLHLISLLKIIKFNICLFHSIIKPVLASVAMIISIYILNYVFNNLFIPITFVFGGLIYAILLLITKAIPLKSIKNLRK